MAVFAPQYLICVFPTNCDNDRINLNKLGGNFNKDFNLLHKVGSQLKTPTNCLISSVSHTFDEI